MKRIILRLGAVFLSVAAIAAASVLSGTFLMGMTDKFDRAATQLYKPGSYILLPAREHHFAWCKTRTP